ncbi:unnamed protein product [Musa acuminata subsp. malaccensis]|uniref:(wild Malaysian banana) hypothetical protein n=1 Tax=Musa acuminata subsp. malaccensis TaxID=214687 RepID=A0A804KS82_MUSAM|nr:unnamed protein product [Musa acuminata subsp. malaccensis]
MAEPEVIALREAIRSRSTTLEKLYGELEEEREAAASGADEALSMIVRLQEEKAAEKMKASQYKRLAEEKLRHAKESSTILKDVIFQKEMEIASLVYQVQAYKHRLLSLGLRNMDDDVMMRNGNRCRTSLVRNISLPALLLEELSSGLHVTENLYCGIADNMEFGEEHDAAKLHEFMNLARSETAEAHRRATEWQQKLEYHDKFHMNSRMVPVKMRQNPGCSWYLQLAASDDNKFDNSTSNIKSDEGSIYQTKSVNLQDFHDVQENHNRPSGSRTCSQLSQEHFETKCMNRVPIARQEEAMCNLPKDQHNNFFSHAHHKNKLYQPWEEAPMDCPPTPGNSHDAVSLSHNDLEQLRMLMQKFKDDMRDTKQENLERGRKQLQSLRRIIKHLDSIESQVNNTEFEHDQEDDSQFTYLVEVMLCYFLCTGALLVSQTRH